MKIKTPNFQPSTLGVRGACFERLKLDVGCWTPAPARRAFTLLELVVIIAVIGILAAAVTPTVMNEIMDTRVQATQDEAKGLYEAMVGSPNGDGTRFDVTITVRNAVSPPPTAHARGAFL